MITYNYLLQTMAQFNKLLTINFSSFKLSRNLMLLKKKQPPHLRNGKPEGRHRGLLRDLVSRLDSHRGRGGDGGLSRELYFARHTRARGTP